MNVISKARIPIMNWASQIESGAIDQAINLADLEVTQHHVALMPDAHQGFGMPIGGVIFTDGAVIPNAVGVDIGCGVALLSTGMQTEDLNQEERRLILDGIAARVPTGFDKLEHPRDGATVLKAMGYIGVPSAVDGEWFEDTLNAVGTLGGGNHFIELQADELGYVYVMLHSGSRGLGQKIGKHYHERAVELNTLWHTKLPTKDLAYFPRSSDEMVQYMSAQNFGLRWAEYNREMMLEEVMEVLSDWPCKPVVEVNVHHNFAAREHHYGQDGLVHRKGAIRARVGDKLLIPGSMGAHSYIAQGLGNPLSYDTCQHGAGRAMGRADAKRRYEAGELEDLGAFMSSRNILMAGKASTAIDEHPGAYKDIEMVMADSADLVSPLHTMTPLGVVKG
jgi:tRNA-splicing ligase RtcB